MELFRPDAIEEVTPIFHGQTSQERGQSPSGRESSQRRLARSIQQMAYRRRVSGEAYELLRAPNVEISRLLENNASRRLSVSNATHKRSMVRLHVVERPSSAHHDECTRHHALSHTKNSLNAWFIALSSIFAGILTPSLLKRATPSNLCLPGPERHSDLLRVFTKMPLGLNGVASGLSAPKSKLKGVNTAESVARTAAEVHAANRAMDTVQSISRKTRAV